MTDPYSRASGISEQSGTNLGQAFERAMLSSLVRTPADICEIASVQARSADEIGDDTPLLVVTISSFAFRLLMIFHIAETPALREYFAPGLGADRQFTEAFAETANLCCGALSRELSAHFPHRAMSSPYVLHSQCAAFLDNLRAQYLHGFAVTINEQVRLEVTLCMCCSGPVEILRMDSPSEEHADVIAGELEMF